MYGLATIYAHTGK